MIDSERSVILLMWLGCVACVPTAGRATPPEPHSPAVATDTVPLRGRGPITDTEMTLFPEPEERTWLRLGGLRIILRELRADHGRLPEKIEDFRPAAGTEWIDYELDAWGEPIVYRVCPSGYELRSAGIDRRLDTEDDLILTDTAALPPPGDASVRARLPGEKSCSRPGSG
jgi:hypothetical protein